MSTALMAILIHNGVLMIFIMAQNIIGELEPAMLLTLVLLLKYVILSHAMTLLLLAPPMVQAPG